MPRFFFNIYDGASIRDQDGTVLANCHEAQAAAIRTAGSVIAENAQRMNVGDDWQMEVTSEAGLVLFRLDFHVAASPAIPIDDKPGQRPATEARSVQ